MPAARIRAAGIPCLADSAQAGTRPTRLPSESLNHAASPPPGIRATPFSVRVSGVSYSSNRTPRPRISSTAARTSLISCLEKAGFEGLKSHLLDVERLGPAQVLGRQRRRNPRRLHDGMV